MDENTIGGGKAAARASWNRHQRFLRQKKRGQGRGRRPHERVDGDVEGQHRRYEDERGDLSPDTHVGADYEEWLVSCPKDMPEYLQRQRQSLPDVSYLLLSSVHGPSVPPGTVSVKDNDGLDLGALADVLDLVPEFVYSDVAQVRRYRAMLMVHDPFVMIQTEPTLPSADQESIEHGEESSSLVDDLDALLNLGDGQSPATQMIDQDEQEDLDAWFEAL